MSASRAWPEGTDELLEEILTDAYGEDEQLWALRQAFEDDVSLPADAFVVGEPVSVIEIDYDGNTRRGLIARCRRGDGTEHEVSAAELAFPDGSPFRRHVAAYRMWVGPAHCRLPPGQPAAPTRRPPRISTLLCPQS